MNFLERVSDQSHGVLDRIGGDLVTFLKSASNPTEVTVWSLINRSSENLTPLDSEIVTQMGIGVIISIRTSNLNFRPVQNQIIREESTGETHRVALVKPLGGRYRLFCETQ